MRKFFSIVKILSRNHNHICIAKVCEYDYNDTARATDDLEILLRAVKILNMVCLMQRIVPEFISKNN